MTYTFAARLWEYEGEAPWVFVTLPREESDEIADSVEWRPGFGAVKVTVRIGDTEWSTSLFPSKELGAYVLPIKRAVRERERIDIGDEAVVTITVAG
ncbi:MAG: DUF1905 domain-containing protein [Acidimicrobiia bacterium]|nr:DUF1905 domain-containing protein [Acidimicrobiia bacterium]